MANSWIEHVKKYAAKNKMPYGKAISAARASYKKGSKSKTMTGKDFTGRKGDVSKSKGKDVKKDNKNRDFHTMPNGKKMKGKTHPKISSKISSRKPDVKRAAKRTKAKMETVELDGEKVKFRKGGLHKSLRLEMIILLKEVN